MRQWRRMGLLFITGLLLTGCWDRVEINDLAIVLGTAFDRAKEEGKRYQVAIQVPLPGAIGGSSEGGGGGTGGEGTSYFVDYANGRTIREAKSVLQERMSRQLNFAHRRVVLIGEELAQEGIRDVLDVIQRTADSRINAYILITEGEGVSVLEGRPHLERFPAESIREIAKLDLDLRVKQVLDILHSTGVDPVIPVVRRIKKGEKGAHVAAEITLERYALFKQERLHRFSTNEETEGIRWLMGGMKNRTITFPYSAKEMISLQMSEQKAKSKIALVEGRPELTMTLQFKGLLLESEAKLDLLDVKTIQALEIELQRHIEQMVGAIWERAKKEQIDFLGVGRLLAQHEPHYWSTVKGEWPRGLEETQLRLRFNFSIDRIGLIGKSP